MPQKMHFLRRIPKGYGHYMQVFLRAIISKVSPKSLRRVGGELRRVWTTLRICNFLIISRSRYPCGEVESCKRFLHWKYLFHYKIKIYEHLFRITYSYF